MDSLLGFLSLLMLLCCKSYGDEQKVKHYLTSEKIMFQEKQIFVYVNQCWQPTQAIFTDETGFYFIDNQGGWMCGCGYYNEDNNWTCGHCGRRRE